MRASSGVLEVGRHRLAPRIRANRLQLRTCRGAEKQRHVSRVCSFPLHPILAAFRWGKPLDGLERNETPLAFATWVVLLFPDETARAGSVKLHVLNPNANRLRNAAQAKEAE